VPTPAHLLQEEWQLSTACGDVGGTRHGRSCLAHQRGEVFFSPGRESGEEGPADQGAQASPVGTLAT